MLFLFLIFLWFFPFPSHHPRFVNFVSFSSNYFSTISNLKKREEEEQTDGDDDDDGGSDEDDGDGGSSSSSSYPLLPPPLLSSPLLQISSESAATPVCFVPTCFT